jgi:hypothetical protein
MRQRAGAMGFSSSTYSYFYIRYEGSAMRQRAGAMGDSMVCVSFSVRRVGVWFLYLGRGTRNI